VLDTAGFDATIAAALVHGTGTPDGGLTKIGNGTLTLSGASTYNGATAVSGGTLAVNGSIGTNTVTVTNATISGTGTIGGATTLQSGGVLAAGSGGIGTLHFSTNLTLNALSTNTFAVTAAGGASNQVAVAGILTPNSSVIKVTSGTALGLSTNTLFSYSNSVSGTFNPTVVFDVAPRGHAAIVNDASNGRINLVVTNAAPVAVSPLTSLGVTLGVPATVKIIGGKYSFTDPEGDALVVTNVSGAANGTLSTDGTNITYTATGGTSDSFTYTVSDPYGGTNIQTVSVTISASGQSQNVVSMTSPDGFGNVFFKYAGIPNYNYALEGITNTSLTPPYVWTPLITNTAAGNGSLFFTNNTSSGYHFFRTHYVP
jgi:autotransporter-associated beta strand protein